MSEVDKRCIYASSEYLKMINLFISYGITEDNVSSLMIVLWDGVAKKAKSLIFKCERERIGWCVGSPEQTKTLSVCYGEKRRYMSPNDAGHQSLRPCYRTRRYGGIGFLLGGECA